MKAVILAGGLGTRLSEETHLKPKPMVEIGGRPILWHIMKSYSQHGINDFIICCGYKSYVIKEFFMNYLLHISDVTFDISEGSFQIHDNKAEPWKVTLVETGASTQTGGRLKRVGEFLRGEDAFCFTYGDGVSDVDISKLVEFHREHGKSATLTAVEPVGRYGALDLNNNSVQRFTEKPAEGAGWINGGFFVLSPKVLDYIDGDTTSWEAAPLEKLAAEGNLEAYRHHGFWHAMDTLRDRNLLEDLWRQDAAPWKVWA